MKVCRLTDNCITEIANAMVRFMQEYRREIDRIYDSRVRHYKRSYLSDTIVNNWNKLDAWYNEELEYLRQKQLNFVDFIHQVGGYRFTSADYGYEVEFDFGTCKITRKRSSEVPSNRFCASFVNFRKPYGFGPESGKLELILPDPDFTPRYDGQAIY